MNRTILILVGLLAALLTAAGMMWYNSPLNTARRQLHSTSPLRCRDAIFTLSDLEDKVSIPTITKLLRDKNPIIRPAAIWALGNLGAQELTPEFIDLLQDKDPKVRARAAEALGNFGAKEAVPKIIKLLHDNISEVRMEAAYTLNKLGAKEAIPEIRKLFTTDNSGDSFHDYIIDALAKFNDKESIPIIRKYLNNADHVTSMAAAFALGKLGDEESTPQIIPLLKDMGERGTTWRGLAAISLIELGAKDKVTKGLIPDIKKFLSWNDSYYSKRAEDALRKLGLTEEEIEEAKKK